VSSHQTRDLMQKLKTGADQIIGQLTPNLQNKHVTKESHDNMLYHVIITL
jgi:hypothetical protein